MTDPDGINQYWDMVAGGVARTDDGVDPVVARQIDGLHARQFQPGPDPAFLQRLRRGLTTAPALQGTLAQPDAARDRTREIGRSSVIVRPGRGWSRVSVLPWSRPVGVAIALLLVAVIVTGASTYRQDRHRARLAAVVTGIPTTDLYMTVFDELEGADFRLAPLDPITLADRPERDPLNLAAKVALSPDGSTMVTVDSPARDGQPSKKTTVVVRDGATGTEQRRFDLFGASYGLPRLSRDGSRLVLNGGQDGAGLDGQATIFQVVDTGDGRVISTVPYVVDDEWPVETWIDPDATRLYSLFLPHTEKTTGPGPARIVAHDLTTGAEAGHLVLPDVRAGSWNTGRTVTPNESTGDLPVMASLTPGVALSPDGATIALAHADDDAITLVDAKHLTVRGSVAFAPPSTLPDRLLGLVPFLPRPAVAKMLPEGTTMNAVFSADGRHLYLLGRTTTYGDDGLPAIEPLGLRSVDLGDGTEVVSNSDAEWLQVFPSTDARSLYALRYRSDSSGPLMLQRLDAETLEVEAERDVPGVGYPHLLLRPSVPDGNDAIR